MIKRMAVLIIGLTLTLGISCTELEQEPVVGQLPMQQIELGGSIPLDYGELVGITNVNESPYQAALWFERPDKAIVVVRVNYSLGSVLGSVLTIPRQ